MKTKTKRTEDISIGELEEILIIFGQKLKYNQD